MHITKNQNAEIKWLFDKIDWVNNECLCDFMLSTVKVMDSGQIKYMSTVGVMVYG